MAEIKIAQFATEDNYEYQIIDDEGDIFLQGDGFKSEEETFNWLMELSINLDIALQKSLDKDNLK